MNHNEGVISDPAADVGSIVRCPGCGESTEFHDVTGIICFACNTFFDSGEPDPVGIPVLNPKHLLESITRSEADRISEVLRCHHDEPCTVIVLKQADRIAVLEVALAGLISAVTSECPKPVMWSGEPSQLHEMHSAIKLGRQALRKEESRG